MFKSDQEVSSIVGSDTLLEAESWESKDGATVVWMFENNEPVALFGATDLPRKEATEAVSLLKKMNVRTVMLTGDNDGAARVIQRVVGVSERRSKLLPRDKVDAVREIKFSSSLVGEEFRVVMVGDGVNDAPALALADVGIAMGVSGTVVAMETADVALMDNDLRKIPEVIALGRSVVSKIRQNVTISLASKLFVMGLALAGYVYLWLAILVDVGGMILVTLNGLTLLSSVEKRTDDCCSSGTCEKEKPEKKDDCCSSGACEKEKPEKDDCCSSGACEKEKPEKKKDDCCSSGACEKEKPEKKDDCCSSGACEKEKPEKKDDCCSSGACEKEKPEKDDCCSSGACEKEEPEKKDDCCSSGACEKEKPEKKDDCCSSGACEKEKPDDNPEKTDQEGLTEKPKKKKKRKKKKRKK